MRNVEFLPVVTGELAVTRPSDWKEESKMLNFQLQTLDSIAFDRVNDEGEVEEGNGMRHDFRAVVYKDRSPEVFNLLKNAPLGTRVQFTGRLGMQRAQVNGSGGRSYNIPLAQIEITEATITAAVAPVEPSYTPSTAD